MKRPSILIVDDEKTICEVLERILGKQGYDIQTTQDARQALEKIENDFFNLLIVDLKMPEMTGVELLKKVKEINPYIEVIIATGYGTLETAVEAIKSGAFDYIAKPFNAPELGLTVSKCLEKQKLTLENVELRELVALFDVSKTIISTVDLDSLLVKVLAAAMLITKAKRGSLLLLADDPNELVVKSLNGFESEIQAGSRLTLTEEIAKYLAVSGKTLIIDNKPDAPITCQQELAGIVSFPLISVPFIFQNKVLGVVNICEKISGEKFSERESVILDVLASQAAIAIQNAGLYGQLQNKIEELEHTIQALNETQAQLVHSEKLASVGRLTAGAVHEICNPLNVISGRAQLLLMDADPDSPLARSLRIIEDHVSRTSRIASNLLKFAKPSKLEVKPVNVNQALDDMLALVENRIFLKDIEIVKNFLSPIPNIRGNSQELQQVFLNMVLNAKQSMDDEGNLTISTSLTPQKDFVEVSFRDTGCGISQDSINKIFDPFFTSKDGGTGLGLSVSYGIVKAHNGAIEVSSEEGDGTTFVVKLPVVKTVTDTKEA